MSMLRRKILFLLFVLLTVCFKPSAAADETSVPAGPQIYTVQDGDSCWSIITEFGVPLDLFLKVNNLDATCPLYIGKLVIIPGPDQKMPTPTPVVLDQYQPGQQIVYEVEINDTYEGIASKFNTTLDSIRKLNDIEDIDSFPTFGQVLAIAVNLVTPTPSPADETPVTSAPQIYAVQDGDSCWSIITEFGVPLDLFLKVNNLDATCPLYIGKLVIIPAPDQEMPAPTPVVLDQYQPGEQIIYEVEINDTYEGIASKFNTTLDSIRELNDIEDIDSFPTYGQVLIIAVNLAAQDPSPAADETPVPAGPQIYTVQEGDNCWSIVTEFGVPLDQFLKVNNLDETCPLYVGKLLIIPAQVF